MELWWKYYHICKQLVLLFFKGVENKLVADKLLEKWPNIVKVVKFWEKLPKSRRPESKSYANLVSVVDDPLIKAKLTFLKKYQNGKPMLPFLYGDLKNLVKSLLKIIIKPEQLEKYKNGANLKNLNLDDQTLH